ncbi:hypothetical protein EDD17DRAFT_1506862 [Pisolithus thermaeus]|nr:hypothetical protein EDD17DRAFT_1506862 [Pisolithus thermaeus]
MYPHQCPTSTSPHTSFSPPSLISMARTKQTARKKKKAKAKAASKNTPLKIPANDNAVIYLPRVMKADVKFMCMTCHRQKTKNDPKPYMVLDYNFSKLPFNHGTPEPMDAYDYAASDLANTLAAYSRVVLILTTHSDEDREIHIFTGYTNKKPVTSQVFPFLQLLLRPLSKILNGADMLFYVCGFVVTHPESFNGVKEVAQHPSLKYFILANTIEYSLQFDAQHLQLASMVPYLQSLLDNTIIQGFPISSAAKVALNDCGCSAGKTISFECQYPFHGKNIGAGGVSLPPSIATV